MYVRKLQYISIESIFFRLRFGLCMKRPLLYYMQFKNAIDFSRSVCTDDQAQNAKTKQYSIGLQLIYDVNLSGSPYYKTNTKP